MAPLSYYWIISFIYLVIKNANEIINAGKWSAIFHVRITQSLPGKFLLLAFSS